MEITSEPPGASVTIQPTGVTLTTPAKVDLSRNLRYRVRFELEGYETVTRVLRQEGSGAAGGNVLLGGIIGAAIDESNGAAYNLVPDPLHAILVPVDQAAAALAASSATESRTVVLSFLNTSGASSSGRITIWLDGRKLAKLRSRQYLTIEVEPGAHFLEIEHLDLFKFHDEYKIDIPSTPCVIEVYSTLTSTDYLLVDLPLTDPEGRYTRVPLLPDIDEFGFD